MRQAAKCCSIRSEAEPSVASTTWIRVFAKSTIFRMFEFLRKKRAKYIRTSTHKMKDTEEKIAPIRDEVAANTDEDPTSSASGGLSGEAAGVVRGVSRSLVRAPLIGRLPKPSPGMVPKPPSMAVGRSILRRRVPVRRVARVSDRVSTGWDWYNSALEVDETSSSTAKPTTTTTNTSTTTQWMLRARSFTWSLLKNTLLGMAVFEVYGFVVGSFAPPLPPPLHSLTSGNAVNPPEIPVEIHYERLDSEDDDCDDDDHDHDHDIESSTHPDEYSRASLPVHFLAGSASGTIHGLVSTAMDGNPTSRSLWRYTFLNTFHHGMAHAMLFGSYETIKRSILEWADTEERTSYRYYGATSRAHHLIIFALAGGLAGQLQHLTGHFVENAFGLSNQSLQIQWRSAFRSHPALRPLLRAFPPSAIGFIAFEYGKQFIV